MLFSRPTARRVRTVGMTLLEVTITTCLMAAVFFIVPLVQVFTAKQTKVLYGEAKTLHRAHLVAERIYFDLCMAKIGSMSVSEDGRTIEFQNPFLQFAGSTPISAITFEGGNACYYRDKTSAEPDHVTGLVRDVRFQLLGPGNAVRITITTLETSLWKLGRPYQLTTEISVRNPEVP